MPSGSEVARPYPGIAVLFGFATGQQDVMARGSKNDEAV
jgi:hypothetical protein